jgi:hypothetical protein
LLPALRVSWLLSTTGALFAQFLQIARGVIPRERIAFVMILYYV